MKRERVLSRTGACIEQERILSRRAYGAGAPMERERL